MHPVIMTTARGVAAECVERINGMGLSAQLVEQRAHRGPDRHGAGALCGYSVSVLISIRDPLIYWYTKYLLPSFIGNDVNPTADFTLRQISPGVVLSPAAGDTLAMFEEKLMHLLQRVTHDHEASKITPADRLRTREMIAPLIDDGMEVTGTYDGMPFEGGVREVGDCLPAEMHGQPAGRNSYVDLATPIVLDQGKSYERAETSISACACDLQIVEGREGADAQRVS